MQTRLCWQWLHLYRWVFEIQSEVCELCVEVSGTSPWFLSAVGNPCQPNPCENGGTCNPGHGGKLFECVCKEGFSGSKCEGGIVWIIVHFIRWVHFTRAFRLQVRSNVHLNIAQNSIATARCKYGYSTCKLNVLWAQDIVFFERIRIRSIYTQESLKKAVKKENCRQLQRLVAAILVPKGIWGLQTSAPHFVLPQKRCPVTGKWFHHLNEICIALFSFLAIQWSKKTREKKVSFRFYVSHKLRTLLVNKINTSTRFSVLPPTPYRLLHLPFHWPQSK